MFIMPPTAVTRPLVLGKVGKLNLAKVRGGKQAHRGCILAAEGVQGLAKWVSREGTEAEVTATVARGGNNADTAGAQL
jgi:hypothetical protein